MLKTMTRRVALAVAGTAAAMRSDPALAAITTPAQTAGPFYPPPNERPSDTDWDLVKVEGQVQEAGGEVMHLFGQVLTVHGAPVADALVEIWQCDVNGRYHHSGDSGEGRPLDNGFQGFGAVRTDAEGGYRFRTIRPVSYPGRTPHIHARIVPSGGRELITQIYLLDAPGNQLDFIFRSLGAARQAAASIDPVLGDSGDLEAGFNFVI